jgi:hypothetical protein
LRRRADEPFDGALHAADQVFFQSEFFKLSQTGSSASVPAVSDPLQRRRPVRLHSDPDDRSARLTLLLAGTQYQWYRVEAALRTVAVPRVEACFCCWWRTYSS